MFIMHYTMLVLVLFFMCMGSVANGDVTSSQCIEGERQALLSFKESLTDIHNNLSDWGHEEEKRDCCKWVGISCNGTTGHVIRIDLSTISDGLAGKINPSLQQLHELKYLHLNGINFQSNPIPNFLGSLTNLRYLDISAANLSGSIPHELGNLPKLYHLDVSRNLLEGYIPYSLANCSSLEYLHISAANLSGSIPDELATLPKLFNLDLSWNFLEGYVPYSFGNCSSLFHLGLSYNHLSGPLPKFVECSALSNLSLSHNSLNGSIPDLSGCIYLDTLDLSHNNLSGNLPNTLGQTSNLGYLDVSSNSLKGIIHNFHFLNLTNLYYLDLSFNPFSFDPSFNGSMLCQLTTIKLRSCKLGPGFPVWLQNQSEFTHLDISSAGIADGIPTWFWNRPTRLRFLNLSSNEINGVLPNITSNFDSYPGIDLSNNHLEGTLSLLPSKLASLNLSGNRFSGTLFFLCLIDANLTFLDLSDNLLSGGVPACLLKFQENLVVLNLSNNTLSGEIPSSLGFLHRLEALYLRANSFVGELPTSLGNCTKLRFVDLGKNKLFGNIPSWIGETLSELYVLVLKSNRFNGSLPYQICWLKNLQILDMSMNELSGNIPLCFSNFTAMARKGSGDDITNHYYSSYINGYQLSGRRCSIYNRCRSLSATYHAYQIPTRRLLEQAPFYDKTLVAWKGTEREFGGAHHLLLLKSIDISSNKLSGKLPSEITSLHELVSLNFSTNQLDGGLPKGMGQLKNLESLDLSRNEFFGNIPFTLSQITYLDYLDLSNNNFSGRIPSGTQLQLFNSSSYSGNPQLCGPPLTRRCGIPPAIIASGHEDNEEDEGDFWESYYTGAGVGFAFGFWGVCCVLIFNSR